MIKIDRNMIEEKLKVNNEVFFKQEKKDVYLHITCVAEYKEEEFEKEDFTCYIWYDEHKSITFVGIVTSKKKYNDFVASKILFEEVIKKPILMGAEPNRPRVNIDNYIRIVE
jgi:hypothetical protein